VSKNGYQADDPVYEQMIVGMPQLRHPTFVRPVFSDAELRELRAPTLLLIGDHEIMYEPRRALERATQLLPNLRAELVPNAGHMLNSDQPAVVDERMLQFLSDDMKEGSDLP
jgi:pimeloyl-ACP methyl ester carboxylesterase